MIRAFRALTTDVAVTIDDDLPLGEVARALIASYPEAGGAPALSYHLRGGPRPALVKGDDERVADEPEDVVPLFELDLYREVSARAAPGWLLHAAALEIDGGALVLAGVSGDGKTTATLALAARGHRLLTEEIALVGSDLMVRGLARPIHVAPARAGVPIDWRQHGYPIRAAGDVVHAHAIAVPPHNAWQLAPIPLRALVRLSHDVARPPHVARLPASVALTSLWPCTLRRDAADLDAATSVLRAGAAWELRAPSIEHLITCLARVLVGT